VPKNRVTDLITDQEMAFVHLVLSGTMTDRKAAETAGLNPETAAYTKAKPRVRAYMLEHRTAVEQKLVEQEADEHLRRKQARERVLARLWEIAALAPEATRNSATAQVRALSLIMAIEGLMPGRPSDRRAASTADQPSTPPVAANFYKAAWLREKEEQAADTQPALVQHEAQAQAAPVTATVTEPQDAAPPMAAPAPSMPPQAPSAVRRVPDADYTPDTRVPFSIRQNPFARYKRFHPGR
jgi:hypothetical protein